MKENQWYVKHLSCQFIIRDGIKKYAVQVWTPDHHLRSYGLKSLLSTYSHNLKNSRNKNGMLPLKNNIWKWMVSLFLFIRTWTKLLMIPIVRNKVSGTLKNLYIPLKKSKECNSTWLLWHSTYYIKLQKGNTLTFCCCILPSQGRR